MKIFIFKHRIYKSRSGYSGIFCLPWSSLVCLWSLTSFRWSEHVSNVAKSTFVTDKLRSLFLNSSAFCRWPNVFFVQLGVSFSVLSKTTEDIHKLSLLILANQSPLAQCLKEVEKCLWAFSEGKKVVVNVLGLVLLLFCQNISKWKRLNANIF